MQFRLFLSWFSVGALLSFGLSACDSHHPESAKQQAQTQPSHEIMESDPQHGMSLTQVAGQVTLPRPVTHKHTPTKLSETELAYVGRYHARIPCTDAFAGCVNNEKEAEYIMNLLEDGSVYWTNTSFGRLGSDLSRNVAKIEQTCKQVQWRVEPVEKEIVVRCAAADVNLYYQINQDQNLVMDLDKIWNGDQGRNRKFFKEYPFPKKAYVFEKAE